ASTPEHDASTAPQHPSVPLQNPPNANSPRKTRPQRSPPPQRSPVLFFLNSASRRLRGENLPASKRQPPPGSEGRPLSVHTRTRRVDRTSTSQRPPTKPTQRKLPTEDAPSALSATSALSGFILLKLCVSASPRSK